MMFLIKRLVLLALVLALVGGLIFYQADIVRAAQTFWATREAQRALARQDWNTAMALYEDAWRDNPDDADIAVALAKIYHRQASYHAPEGFLDYTPAKSAGVQAARKTVETLRHDAQTLFLRAMALKPEATAYQLAYGRFLQDDPVRRPEAIPLYRALLAKDPRNASILAALGDLYKAAGDNPAEDRPAMKAWLYDWATYYYRLSLKRDPAQFQPRFSLGVIYQLRQTFSAAEREQWHRKAAREYCNALKLAPDSSETRYNLGLILVNLHAVDAGFRQLSRAVNILTDKNRIPEAQQIAQQVQAVRNSVFYQNPAQQVQASDLDGWLQACLEEGEAKAPANAPARP